MIGILYLNFHLFFYVSTTPQGYEYSIEYDIG